MARYTITKADAASEDRWADRITSEVVELGETIAYVKGLANLADGVPISGDRLARAAQPSEEAP